LLIAYIFFFLADAIFRHISRTYSGTSVADPDEDPAFYLNADPGSGEPNQCGSGSPGLSSQKVEFLHEKYTLSGL
jgi:hypothetical protein